MQSAATQSMPNIMKNQFEKKSQSVVHAEEDEDVSKAATEVCGKRASQDKRMNSMREDNDAYEDVEG